MAKREPRCGARWQHAIAERNREKLRHQLHVDQLQLGQRIPKNVEAACVLGVTDKRAGMHLQVLLRELRIVWTKTFIHGVRARVVVAVEPLGTDKCWAPEKCD